jgi:DNA polymerase III subunit chi
LEVEFHTGVADKLGFACRLLRKAYRKGARVLVTAPGPTLAALDRELWTFDERDFIPHVRATSRLAARTPIWLSEGAVPDGAPAVLINLGAPVQDDLAPFERVIEVVSREPEDEHGGRLRWREYKGRGRAVGQHKAADEAPA